MKTYSAKPNEVKENWHLIDAAGQPVGRLAVQIATLLRGKNKPEFDYHVNTGDKVVIINAKDIGISGNKREDKMYHHHTGYPGGIKSINFEKLLKKDPAQIIQSAVSGMLPKNKLRKVWMRNLRIFSDDQHCHAAQNPKKIETN